MKSGEDLKVVIAEDDYLVAKDVARCIKELGYSVVEIVADGLQAIEAASRIRPDVIIMDVNMPEVDGIKASQEIQKSCPVPIVVVTAYETDDILERATAAGVGAYLTKPVETTTLNRAITIAIARHDDIMKWQLLSRELMTKNEELKNAFDEIKTLRGIIPICCECKKIRDDEGYWSQVEEYLMKNADILFTHGYCPDCADEAIRMIDKD